LRHPSNCLGTLDAKNLFHTDSLFKRGFRRISHASLNKSKELGFHHLLFRRDSPHLVHRLKKDCDPNEVVRQLELGSEEEAEKSAKQNQHTPVPISSDSRSTYQAGPVPSIPSFAASAVGMPQGLGNSGLQALGRQEQDRQLLLNLLFIQQQREKQIQEKQRREQESARNPFFRK
jgi:hypothetical protein